MKVITETQEGNILTLEIELDAKDIGDNYEKAFRASTQNLTLPGFRKGKIPRELLGKIVNVEQLKKEVIDRIASESYAKIIEERKLETITNPSLEQPIKYNLDEPIQYKVRVEIRPNVILGEYKNMEIQVQLDKSLDDTQLEQWLDTLRYKYAILNPIEDREIKLGDVVTMNTEGFVDGQPIPLGKVANLQVEVKEGNLLPGFTEQIIGACIDDEREVTITLPDNYNWVDLRGKQATFKTKILEIKEFQLPNQDDEFAKTVGDFKSLEELKTIVKIDLERTWEEAQQIKIHRTLFDKIVENASVEIPITMINRELMAMWWAADGKLLKEQNFDNTFLKISLDNWQKREDVKLEAMRRIKTTLVLGNIARTEGIELTQEELENEVNSFAEDRKMTAVELKKYFNEENRLLALMDELLSLKIIGWVMENNKITLLDVHGKVVESEQDIETFEQNSANSAPLREITEPQNIETSEPEAQNADTEEQKV